MGNRVKMCCVVGGGMNEHEHNVARRMSAQSAQVLGCVSCVLNYLSWPGGLPVRRTLPSCTHPWLR